MSGGKRLAVRSLVLVCGAIAAVLVAVDIADQRPGDIAIALAVGGAAGIAVACAIPIRRRPRKAPPAGLVAVPDAPAGPLPAALEAEPAQDFLLTVNLPLARAGTSLLPSPEPSEPYMRLADIVRESNPDLQTMIQVTSPMSGEGKTTVAVNLAASLAAAGDRVLLVDMHLERLRAHVLLGMVPKGVYNGHPLAMYVTPTWIDNLDILCAGDLDADTRIPMATIWRELSALYDWTIIDTEGGVSRSNAGARPHADLSILVARTDHTPPRLVEIARERLHPNPAILVMNAAGDDQPRKIT